jgi:hypothetical protein
MLQTAVLLIHATEDCNVDGPVIRGEMTGKRTAVVAVHVEALRKLIWVGSPGSDLL